MDQQASRVGSFAGGCCHGGTIWTSHLSGPILKVAPSFVSVSVLVACLLYSPYFVLNSISTCFRRGLITSPGLSSAGLSSCHGSSLGPLSAGISIP